MSLPQLMGDGGILCSLLVKENVFKAFVNTFPENIDSYHTTIKGRKILQRRIKTCKKFFPLKHYIREDGVVFSKKECKTEKTANEMLGYPCINDNSRGHAVGPLYIYAFTCNNTSMLSAVLLTGIMCKKYKNNKLREMQLIAKKAEKVFKKHASFLESVGIYVKSVGVLPHRIELKGPTRCD